MAIRLTFLRLLSVFLCRNVMKSRVAQLMGSDYKFDIMMSEDGSGRGAALVAAVLKGEV